MSPKTHHAETWGGGDISVFDMLGPSVFDMSGPGVFDMLGPDPYISMQYAPN